MLWEYAQVRTVRDGLDTIVELKLPDTRRWEPILRASLLDALNSLGNEGWELVAALVDTDYRAPTYTLKRPIS
jgi:hypothetical protein